MTPIKIQNYHPLQTNRLQILILVFFVSILSLNSQTRFDSEKVTNYVEEIKESYNLPGIAVSITDTDKTLYLEHFGKINDNEQLLIGSCSKSFTALLTLKLQDKGLLNINDPVVQYLDWFQYADKNQSDKVIIKDLLHHTSGIPSILGRITIKEDSLGSTKREVKRMLSELSIDTSQNIYQYSNINYRLLGYIVEQVTGSLYGEVLQKEILQPLGLTHTTGFVLKPEDKNFPGSYNYFLYYPVVPYVSSYYKDQIPEGHIASNAEDMAIYLREHLKGYLKDSGQIINQKLSNTLFTPRSQNSFHYGQGWFIRNKENKKIVFHTGLTEGFNTCMIIDPQEEKAIFVAINSGVDTAYEIAAGISNILVGKEPNFYSKTFFYLIRSIPLLVLALIIILGLQFLKWKDLNFSLGLNKKLLPNLMLILGILFGSLWVIIFPVMYQTTLKVIINHDPVSGISLIMIAVLIILISLINYFKKQSHNPHHA
ncbi:beta-lactamase family protein [Lutimonas saemankumensis]|uniref:serine hydrolase domain-containing protein n=1 Tax=Lutimonas saemankumensis TaxID=483016 RepID=UPI001CD24795|nr:serine hydrolase domain-containing protein [Lutimonas saemankumensis]MCA0931800.1 beta-lactamase family protein [Lutimonas saemankumensis]